MNAITIKPKTVVTQPARTALFVGISWRTNDDPFTRKLQIVVNNQATIIIEGAEYEALGQWTDETIRDLILDRYGMEPA